MAYVFGDLSEEDSEFKKKEKQKKILDWVLSPLDTAKRKILEKTGSIPSQKEMMINVVYEILEHEDLVPPGKDRFEFFRKKRKQQTLSGIDCPDGMHWIPDREYCSKCSPGQVYNAQWGECQGMDRSVINPGSHHTAAASLFSGISEMPGCSKWILAMIVAATVIYLANHLTR